MDERKASELEPGGAVFQGCKAVPDNHPREESAPMNADTNQIVKVPADSKADKPGGISSGAKVLLATAAVMGGLYFWSPMQSPNHQIGGTPARAQTVMNGDMPGVYAALDPILNSITTRCPANVMTAPWSVSAIVSPGVRENPFAGQLVPPGTPTGPTVVGYQQYRLYASPSQAGHYLWRITNPPMPVSNSDRLNGIDARYQIDLYAVSYRTFDVRTQQWDRWSTKGSFGNDVHFAQFIVERSNGRWTPRGMVYMQPVGMELHSVDCSKIPPLEP
jgi:hypothetical protein